MKNLFTLIILCFLFINLMAQKSHEPPKNPFPEDVFKYDQVLPAYQKPDHNPAVENTLLDVMFAENAKVRLRNGELVDMKSNATAGLTSVLNQLTSFEWQRFSDVSEELLDELSENGSRNTDQAVYNLNNIYRLRISEKEDIWELSSTLEHLPGIIYARPVPKPAPLPTPGNYQALQGYLDPAVNSPSGIDAEYAWTKYGGTGSGITICDIEYSWNYTHADVTKAVGSQINVNVADPFSDNNHGTAVLGEMVSNNNGWGTTGICYNSNIKTCGAYYGSPPSYNPAGAITLSIANLSAGDIILLEQQSDYNGSDGYVPIEWYGNYSPNAQTNNPVYAAIVNAVANNIHVVEAGGNGNVNTGSMTWYGNSGAVIVGAGGGYSWDNLQKLGFSSYGPRFDVQGWGEHVMTTGYGGYYSTEGVNYYYTSTFNGTSSASPIVTGAIALFSSYWVGNVSGTRPTPSYMRTLLKQHGRLQVNPGDGIIGRRPDLKAMIENYIYCAASGGGDEYISGVQCGSITNFTGSDGYVDYSNLYSTNLPSNLTQAITVTNGNPIYPSDQCGIWVDWNRDGDFSDANETIVVSGTPGVGPYTATIAVPAGVSLGECIMRVRINWGAMNPCNATTYGEVEDYTINVTAGVPNYWTGAYNYYWHNAANWSLGHIPTATEDVIMTSAGYHPPQVSLYDDACKNLTIQSGAGLIIAEKYLSVYGDLTINGNLAMNNSAGVIDVYGDVSWKSGSTASFSANAAFYLEGYWTFEAGSNANLAAGNVLFFGAANTYIRSYSASSSFYNLSSIKSSGYELGISSWSTQPLTINGDIYIFPSSQFGVYSDFDVVLKGNINSNGIFLCNFGTLKFDGASQELKMNVGDYFNNLTFSQTGTVTVNNSLSSILDVNGNVLIESGVFNLADRTMKVGGNWTNNVGPSAFTEGTSRVIFDGAGHRYVKTSENFNILEANMGAALRVDNVSSVVTCNQYDWTSGGIDVVAGTFSALDLADNGIFGGYWLNPGGSINLTNSDGWVDLNGNLNIYGGNFNVFGGTTDSYWPWSANASITITGGVLDFKNVGIYIPASSSYTFTENISGGVIRTVGSFNNQRVDFTPTNNTIELYGTADAYLTTGVGCSVDDVLVNKSAADDAPPTPLFDKEGKPIEQTRASTVLAGSSPLTILGDLTLDAGTFDLNTRTVNVAGYVDINIATLKMTSPTDNLTAEEINWNAGSNDNVTAGTFHANYWSFNEGTNVMISTSNTAYVSASIGTYDIDAEFGNLVAGPWSKGISEIKALYPIRVAGNYTIAVGADWQTSIDNIVGGAFTVENGAAYWVHGGADMNIAGSCNISGTLTIEGESVVTSAGDLTFPNTGILNVGPGTFSNNYSSGIAYLAGKLILTTGIVEFSNRSVNIASTFDDQISGGTFRIGKSLLASSAATFQPTGGTVEFINASAGNYVQAINGNYLYNMVLDKPGSSFQVYDNLVIKGSLTINAGVLNSNNKTISIAGDWLNNVGVSAFDETTGRVIFNGSGVQFCSTENFNILEINKPGDLFNVSGATINCQVYDWTSGGIWISPGNFSAADLADNGLYGSFAIWSGTMDLHQDIAQYIDLNGNITVGTTGTLNVYGGNGDSFWPYSSNASITMSGGVLDFKNFGIYVYNSPSYTLTENITGGTIRTAGNFAALNTAFTPTGGTVELYGGTDAGIANVAGSNFHNLAINKSGTDEGSGPLITQDRNGKTITLSRANQVILSGDVLVNGNLTVNAGKLNMGNSGYDITCMGSASIENGATLEMSALSQLKLNASMTVKNGGTFRSTGGGAGLESWVTRAVTNRYLFEVQSGGNIGASNTIFEYMGANGINIASGAVVDPAQAFNNSTFRQGLSANTLLTMNSTQTLECTGAIFPANTWGGTNNVKKTNNAGRITFYDYTGGFAGAAYESDPYSRVDWFTPGLSASPLTLNVTPPAGTAIINITSNLAWTATESSAWFSISPLSGTNNGTITVTYNQNTSASGRSGTVTLSAPAVPNVIVTVTQAGATLAVTPASRSVTAPAGTTTFSVASNTAWTVSESVSWFTVSPMSGMANGTLTVNYDENTSVTARSGQITVSSAGLPNVVVTVNQAGASPTLTITPANRNVTSPAGSTTFSLTSNTGWVVTESVAWFTAAPMSGSGNGTLTVNYVQNATGSARVGSIVVTASGGSPVVTVTVSQSAYPSQAISLSAGWQGLSSYIMPADNNIVNVFAPLSPKLIIAQTLSGIYYPAGPINTIGTWASQSAYAVKMNSAATLSISGMPETDKTLPIAAGWNLIPVITNNPVNVATLPTTVGFQIVKDVAGTGVYWPAMSINTLGNLLPGKAYYVRVTSAGIITFPASSDAGWNGEYPETPLIETPWNQPAASPVSHLVAFAPGVTAELMAGDIIGLFTPENICCGVAQVEIPGEPLAITAFADDAQQSGTSGYVSGQTISLKIYRPATNEVALLAVVYELSGDGSIFADHGQSVITHIQQTATGIGTASSATVEIYPNPTDGTITITGLGQYSLLQLYSAHGELLLQRTNDSADALSWDVSALPPGVYQLKLSGDHPAVVKKLIRK
jgi:hypothetical protein